MFIWYSHTNKECRQKEISYNVQGIEFNGEGWWSFDADFARNLEIFGVDNSSSSTLIIKKSFSVLGEGLTQGINDSTGASEK